MHPLSSSNRPRGTAQRSRLLAVAAACAVAGLAIGCASPAPPRPPSLHLAKVVTDLSAERIGDRVRLRWTTADRTTDNLPVPAPLTAEICRETAVSPSRQSPNGIACNVVLRVPVKPGPTETSEALPSELTADPIVVLHYRVRILNPDDRSAGDSKAVLVPSGAAPPPVLDLRASASRAGAVIAWTSSSTPVVVELERRLAVPAQPPKGRTTGDDKRMQLPGTDEPVVVHLLSADSHSNTADPGGTVDTSARRGASYIYRAQRLRTTTINGQALELRSELSPPVTLRMTDTFPPAAPAGLASVPSSANGRPAIDLSWEPDVDLDLAGYNIYRRDASGSFVRLNADLVRSPAYTDAAVTAGARLTYRITAIDASGNESPPSAEITETAQALNP